MAGQDIHIRSDNGICKTFGNLEKISQTYPEFAEQEQDYGGCKGQGF